MADSTAADLDLPHLQAAGHVQAWEEAKAIELVKEQFKVASGGKAFEFITCGWFITVQIYIRPEALKVITRDDGESQTLYISQKTQQNDKYQSCAALVVGAGKQAYQGTNADGSKKFPEGPWCRVGDFVMVPKYEVHLINYRGVTLGMIQDDRIMGVVTDPADIEAVHLSDEF